MSAFTPISASFVATNPAAIASALISPGQGITLDLASLQVVSGTSSLGFYDGSLAALGIGPGLLLTSGTMPGTANTVGFFGRSNGMAGDPMLDAVINTVFPTVSYDATTVSVSFTVTDPTITSVSFNVVFGSDEFPEWVNKFVDIAAIWVNGVDYAYFNNDPKAPLSIIGSNLAANYFIDNTGNLTTASFGGVARPGVASKLPIEYDGVSAPLTIVAPVHQGLNTLKIGIADTGDHIYDSGLFISNMQASTLPVTGITRDVDGTVNNDELQGTDTPETLKGLGGDDDIHGGGGNDVVQAGDGNDFITGDAGNDYIDGGAGTDTAAYSGASTDYAITANADGSVTITDLRAGSPDGTDTLVNVEKAQFTDVTLVLATMQPTAAVTPPIGTVPVPLIPPPPPVVLPPVLAPVQASATEDGAVAEADAFANITVDDTGLTVVNVPAVLPAGVMFNAAVHGFFLDPSDAAYQSLAAGEQTTVSVDYGVANGADITPASVVFTVTGTNDAPVVGGAIAVVAIEDGAVMSIDALKNASDIDHGAVLSVVAAPAVVPVVVTPATAPGHGKDDATQTTAPVGAVVLDLNSLPAGVTFDAATNSFAIDPSNAAYQPLSAGQMTTVTVNYGVSDGIATTAASLQFMVTGTNDAPVVSGPVTGVAVNEDAAAGSYNLQTLLATAHDIDQNDVLTVAFDPTALPAGVSYTATPAHDEPEHIVPAHVIPAGPRGTTWGGYIYPAQFVPAAVVPAQHVPATSNLSLDPSNAAYQSLAQGEERSVVVNYTVSDGTISVPAQAIFVVNGMNDAPVVSGAVTASTTEDGTIVTVGALANATDVDHGSVLSLVAPPPPPPPPVPPAIGPLDSAHDAAEAAAALAAAAPIPPQPFDPATLPAGVTFDAATNSFSIDPSNAAFQSLAQGQTTTVTVNYGVTDGLTVTAGQTVFTVTGTNDAPVVSGPATLSVHAQNAAAIVSTLPLDKTVAGVEDVLPPWVDALVAGGVPAAQAATSILLLANATDVDRNDTLSVVGLPAMLPAGITHIVTQPTTTPSTVYYGAPIVHPGVDALEIDPADPSFRGLAQGETETITVNYGVSDGIATTAATVVFTIIGINDAPVVSGPVTGTVAEDAATLTINGLADATDVDHGTVLTVVNVPAILPAGVSFDATTNSFAIDPSNAAYQPLSVGQSTTVSFNYGVSDGIVTTAASASFTLTGTNDVPVVSAPLAFSATEDGLAQVINPLANASDIDAADALKIVPAALPSYIKLVTVPGGYYQPDITTTTFNPADASFQSLAQGEVKTVTWNYEITDGHVSTPASANFTVTGVNDAPVVPSPVATTTEDGLIAKIDVMSTATDVDHGAVLSLVNAPAVLPAGITFDAATHTLSLDPTNAAFQSLAQGQVGTYAVGFGVSDGLVTTPAKAIFSVVGVNDAPIVSGPSLGDANEDGAIANIDPLLNVTDIDTPIESLRVVGLPATLPAGVTFNPVTQKFFLDPTNAAYQSLSLNETTTVTIPFSITDGYATVPTSASFTVTGKNDAPVVTGPVDGGAVTDSGAPLAINLLARASDIDHLDVLSVSQTAGKTVTASVTSGTWTPLIAFTVVNNQLTLDPTQFKALGAGESLGITFNYTVTDGNPGGVVAASAHVTVTGQNNAPAGVSLSSPHIAENSVAGTVVGQVLAIDPDRTDTFTYQMISDANGFFTLSGNSLVVAPGAAIDYETVTSDAIAIRVTDASGATAVSNLTIAIDNVLGVTINGSGANDTYTPTSAVATTPEADTVNGNNGDDFIDGGGGDDILNGGAGNDTIFGGAGNDIITGGVGADVLNGGDGNDRFLEANSEGAGDTINGGAGIDTLVMSGNGPVTLTGFNATASSIEVIEGNAKGLVGTSAAETFDLSGISLMTGSGIGFLDAGDGNDKVIGSKFADDLRGGAGNDTIEGGLGNDTLTGGAGADSFVFNALSGLDLITDFVAGTGTGHDMLDFSTGIFANFAAVKAAGTQSGSDTLISFGGNAVTLKGVTLGNLVSADVTFH